MASSRQLFEVFFKPESDLKELVVTYTKGAAPASRETNKKITKPYEFSPLYSVMEEEGSPARTIRLLYLLPGTRQDDIECRLVVSDLDQAWDKFEALSYVWGNASLKTPIQVDGATLDIGLNLRSALLNLRLESVERILWVDAICIDQSNITERNRQVAIMGDIYRSASRTVVWLGEDDDFRKGLFVLARIGNDARSVKEQPDRAVDVVNDGFYKKVLNDQTFDLILSHEWWTRVWTLQEIVLAKKAVVVAGTDQFDWDLICEAIEFGKTKEIWIGSLFGKPTPSSSSNYDSYVAIKNLSKSSSTAERILECISLSRYRRSSDPRDKIFAPLGVVIANLEEMGVQPDYTSTVEWVYTNMTKRLIEHSDNYDILGMCFRFQQQAYEDMPSWVADWSSAFRIPEPLRYDAEGVRRTTHASRNTLSHARFEEDSILVVQGQVIDTVASLSVVQSLVDGDNYTLESTLDEAIQNLDAIDSSDSDSGDSSEWQGFTKSVVNPLREAFQILPVVAQSTSDIVNAIIKTAVDQLTVYIEWEQFVQNMRLRHPPGTTVGDPMALYWRTLCTGTYAAGGVEETEALFRIWLDKLSPARRLLKWKLNKKVPRLYNIMSFSGYVKKTWREFGTFVNYLVQTEGRRLGGTENGYLCLLPRSTTVGDKLVILKGGRVPVILRPIEGGRSYFFIGEAYVHGIMNGEAFQESRCVDMRIR